MNTKNNPGRGGGRDYSIEHYRRRAKKKRYNADIEKDKAAAFDSILKARGVTFNAWINNQIDNELKADQ